MLHAGPEHASLPVASCCRASPSVAAGVRSGLTLSGLGRRAPMLPITTMQPAAALLPLLAHKAGCGWLTLLPHGRSMEMPSAKAIREVRAKALEDAAPPRKAKRQMSLPVAPMRSVQDQLAALETRDWQPTSAAGDVTGVKVRDLA